MLSCGNCYLVDAVLGAFKLHFALLSALVDWLLHALYGPHLLLAAIKILVPFV